MQRTSQVPENVYGRGPSIIRPSLVRPFEELKNQKSKTIFNAHPC